MQFFFCYLPLIDINSLQNSTIYERTFQEFFYNTKILQTMCHKIFVLVNWDTIIFSLCCAQKNIEKHYVSCIFCYKIPNILLNILFYGIKCKLVLIAKMYPVLNCHLLHLSIDDCMSHLFPLSTHVQTLFNHFGQNIRKYFDLCNISSASQKICLKAINVLYHTADVPCNSKMCILRCGLNIEVKLQRFQLVQG